MAVPIINPLNRLGKIETKVFCDKCGKFHYYFLGCKEASANDANKLKRVMGNSAIYNRYHKYKV